MKDLNYYKSLNYKVEVEGGFVFSIPNLPGSLTCCDNLAYCDNLSEGYELIKDAKEHWLKTALENKLLIDEPGNSSKISAHFKLKIPKSLHRKLVHAAKS